MTTITKAMLEAAERALVAHDNWELAYGCVGSGEAARAILEAALATTTPPTGAAEIEPKPQDGRRWENRVSALEAKVEAETKWLFDMIQKNYLDLSQQVQALTERVNQHEAGFMQLAQGIGVGDMFAVDHATPLQPADDAEKYGEVWRAARSTWQVATSDCAGATESGKAAVAKAVELGLVPRIDPEDEAQVRVVADLLPEDDDDINERLSKRILAALAEQIGGTA